MKLEQNSEQGHDIARIYHGIQHVSRTAMHAVILANLYRLFEDPEALILTQDQLKLVQIVLLFHDAAREDEAEAEARWDHERWL